MGDSQLDVITKLRGELEYSRERVSKLTKDVVDLKYDLNVVKNGYDTLCRILNVSRQVTERLVDGISFPMLNRLDILKVAYQKVDPQRLLEFNHSQIIEEMAWIKGYICGTKSKKKATEST